LKDEIKKKKKFDKTGFYDIPDDEEEDKRMEYDPYYAALKEKMNPEAEHDSKFWDSLEEEFNKIRY